MKIFDMMAFISHQKGKLQIKFWNSALHPRLSGEAPNF